MIAEKRSMLASRGLFGLLVPPALGGSGLSAAEYARAIQRLGWIDPSLACSVGAHNALVCSAMVVHGMPSHASSIRQLAAGDRIGALCLTEIQAGSDLSGIRTKAVRTADGFRLTGSKAYVTNAPDAGLFLVLAKTSALRFGLFVVLRESPGVHVERALSKAGLHGSPTAILHLDEVLVHDNALLGQPLPNLSVTTTSLAWGRCSLAAGGLGMLERLLPRHDSRLLYARGFVDRCTLALDTEEGTAAQATAFAKLVVSEMVNELLAERIRSGGGCEPELDLVEWSCDARAFTIFEGASEVLRLFVVAPMARGDLREVWWAKAPAVASRVEKMCRMRDVIVERWGESTSVNQTAWLRLADVALAISGLANVATSPREDVRRFAEFVADEAFHALENCALGSARSPQVRVGRAMAEALRTEVA